MANVLSCLMAAGLLCGSANLHKGLVRSYWLFGWRPSLFVYLLTEMHVSKGALSLQITAKSSSEFLQKRK